MSLTTRKYGNILIIGDLNIDTSNKKKDNGNYLSDLCDTFSLKNLITDITCVKFTNGTSIDVLLTNKSRCFHHTFTSETGLRDCHKLILTFFKAYFKRLPPKSIEYRNYKIFNEDNFLYKLDQELSKRSIYKEKNNQYDVFTNIFRMVFDKHALIKKKIVRSNEAPFMTKELSKAIMNIKINLNLRTNIQNGCLVKTSWHLRSRRISVTILTKRRKRTTFPKLVQME